MAKDPIQFYTQNETKLETELRALKKTIYIVSTLRLLVFFAGVLGIYHFLGNGSSLAVVAVIGVSMFAFLLVKSAKLQTQKALLVAKIEINRTEIAVLKGVYSNLKPGDEFSDSQHFYSNDIDLFGQGSFFQYSNRTVTQEGAEAYAKRLTENNIDQIEDRQDAIQELAAKVTWRQHFSAIAALVNVQFSSAKIVDHIKCYEARLPEFLDGFTKVFSFISIALIGLVIFDIISFLHFLPWFSLGLVITFVLLKTTNAIYTSSSKAKETFQQYYTLLEAIEKQKFSSGLLLRKQQEIQTESEKASLVFRKFSKILDAFDQRNNILIAILGNALFLWDIQNAVKVEKWIKSYGHTVHNWFEVIAFFDAQNTLANFHFNHPTFVMPEIEGTSTIIDAQELAHPLLQPNKRIANNFLIDNEHFFIITGANMAGKSTFLRTISLTIVMANMGLPVCAKKMLYNPIKLITSMRTSDSLKDDESYFYAELKRLKFIVNAIQSQKYFIILDEILKGTNSKDKATGSKNFVEKLIISNSTGIIATHDVSLCDLEEEYLGIENYFFDAQIIEDELSFDYTLRKGICKNMNASFLLRKMKII